MSWADLLTAESVTAGTSPLDSQRFGRSISRITVPTSWEGDVENILGEIEKQAADVCIVRYPARNQTWFSAILGCRGDVVLADTLVYWSLDVGSGRAPKPSSDVVTAGGVDPKVIDDLVTEVFSRYANHYAANPLFSQELVLEGYRDWVRRSAESGHMTSLWVDADIAGFATHEDTSGVREILLAGVTPRHQARGLYAHLIAGEEAGAAGSGAELLVISTQGHNTNVQRAWARYGFEPVEAFLTVHVTRRG